ncbi:hypothetical protein [Candidatus Pseudomonas adelgestsugas]|nr:hypothetical protein [Candidatus Pseudomonas adelgestsugas]
MHAPYPVTKVEAIGNGHGISTELQETIFLIKGWRLIASRTVFGEA